MSTLAASIALLCGAFDRIGLLDALSGDEKQRSARDLLARAPTFLPVELASRIAHAGELAAKRKASEAGHWPAKAILGWIVAVAAKVPVPEQAETRAEKSFVAYEREEIAKAERELREHRRREAEARANALPRRELARRIGGVVQGLKRPEWRSE